MSDNRNLEVAEHKGLVRELFDREVAGSPKLRRLMDRYVEGPPGFGYETFLEALVVHLAGENTALRGAITTAVEKGDLMAPFTAADEHEFLTAAPLGGVPPSGNGADGADGADGRR